MPRAGGKGTPSRAFSSDPAQKTGATQPHTPGGWGDSSGNEAPGRTLWPGDHPPRLPPTSKGFLWCPRIKAATMPIVGSKQRSPDKGPPTPTPCTPPASGGEWADAEMIYSGNVPCPTIKSLRGGHGICIPLPAPPQAASPKSHPCARCHGARPGGERLRGKPPPPTPGAATHKALLSAAATPRIMGHRCPSAPPRPPAGMPPRC